VPRSVPDPSSDTQPRIVRVAVEGAPLHLGDHLDYVVPPDVDAVVGHRVELNFSGRRTRGLIVATDAESDVDPARLRPIGRLLGATPWTDVDGVALLQWAAVRFGAPLGDVVRHAFPSRVLDEERRAQASGRWPPDPALARPEPYLVDGSAGRATDVPVGVAWRGYGDIGSALFDGAGQGSGSYFWRPLPGEDVGARIAELATACVVGGRDVLVVVPDPESRVADTLLVALRGLFDGSDDAVLDLRGGLSARRFYRGWLRARAGHARVVVGERSAAFVPLVRLGLAVTLDEASPVHKEQRSPRHHVREVMFERARRAAAVGLATGDVPSAVCRALVVSGRVREVVAPIAVIAQRRPRVHLEAGGLEARARISRSGMRVLRAAVDEGGYGVVLAARRGEGRALVCTRCRDLVRCPSCSAAIARSSEGGRWCPTCGDTSPRAPRCERCGPTELAPLAAGAERLGAELARNFTVPVVVLEGYAPDVPPAPAVLVMTRGSALDRPPEGGQVRGVVLPDMDGALRRPALDAAEDALRLAFRIAGWTVSGSTRHDLTAGSDPDAAPAEGSVATSSRASAAAQVVVESREVDHHALQALMTWDVGAFWRDEEEQRRPLRLPPHATAVRIDVPGGMRDALVQVRAHVAPGDDVIGPLPQAGGRQSLLVRSTDRAATLAALRPMREVASRAGADMRVDVDPVDLG